MFAPRFLLAGSFWLALASLVHAQPFLGLQESPPLSGLFSSRENGAYPATGLANGVSWLINAEGGDHLTVDVRTAVKSNSYPRVQVSSSGGSALISQVGTVDGIATLENFVFPTPGVYQVTIYSNNTPSSFVLETLFGRGVELESGDNNLRFLARSLSPKSVSGGFSASAAGSLDYDEDWYDLGNLAPGNTVNFPLEAPSLSTLDLAATRLELFRDDDVAPLASATGATLVHNVVIGGRYRVRVSMPALQGRFLHFNGGTDQVDLGNPPPLKITGSQTIEFWIKPDDFNSRQNPYAKAYGGEGTMTLETDGTINYFYGTGGGNNGSYQSFNSTARLRVGQWQHLALVRDLDSDPKQLRWYLDGQLVSEATAQYAAAVSSSLNAVLGNGYAGVFRGSLDEVRIWNIARSTGDIQAARTVALTGTEVGLVAYYQFGEGSGNVINDLTTNGISGTIGGAPAWEGEVSATLSSFTSQGPGATYLLRGTVGDGVAPAVTTFVHPVPASAQVFDGTTLAPYNMTALRGNNGQSFLYTLTGGTGGSVWGTDVFTDDSALSRAAVHSGVLLEGETGAVKVTVLPGQAKYYPSNRFGISSNSFGSFTGSYRIERYEPLTPFTWDGIYPRLWVGFSEPIDPMTLNVTGAVTLKGAGPDNTFGGVDDVTYSLSLGSLTWDNRAFFTLGGAVLPPGNYRMTVSTEVKDRSGNALASPYQGDFTVVGKDGYVTESGTNNTLGTADSLSLAPQAGVPSGSFADLGRTVATGANPFDVETADLDADGNTDLVVTQLGSFDGISIFPGNGDKTFGTAIEFPSLGNEPYDAAVADFSGDGLPDIAVTVSGSDKVRAFAWLG